MAFMIKSGWGLGEASVAGATFEVKEGCARAGGRVGGSSACVVGGLFSDDFEGDHRRAEVVRSMMDYMRHPEQIGRKNAFSSRLPSREKETNSPTLGTSRKVCAGIGPASLSIMM
ncbi:hypothetical protein EN819_33430 [Mesorhizobium sp. M1C.F.Ca.ET.176.01.1.1]|nr:hypothetical protein EN819_33430 [Mesorhizobium sp. M1C.F.Ca.ET.176.01.1.1]